MMDKEIIKALECCCDAIKCNKNCPLKYKSSITDCNKEFLALINRQQAEIERLKNGIDDLDCKLSMADDYIAEKQAKIVGLQKKVEELSEVLSDTIRIRYKEAQAEAVKEFAERLKAVSHPYANTQMVFELQIDNLVKEMVGEG